jgi:hypothetical protein
VLASVEPQIMLVLGKRLWDRLPGATESALSLPSGAIHPARVYAGCAAGPMIATFVPHPASRGFSWSKWSEVVVALRNAAL